MMESKLIINDKSLSWFIGFIVINNIIAISFNIDNLYYLFISLALIIIIFKNKIHTINKPIILLYTACVLSLLLNDTPTLFKAWERLLSFILITTLISPLFESTLLTRFKIRLFVSLLFIYQLIVIISLFIHFAGINFYNIEHFTGITKHSMLLAPISAITIITSIYHLTKYQFKRKAFYIYYVIIGIIASLTLLLSASRTALVGLFAAVCIYLIIIYYNKYNYLLKIFLCFTIIIAFTYSLWNPYLENLEKKNTNSMTAGSITSTRDKLWMTRIDEFKSSPIFGIGFSTVDINREDSYFDAESGKIETGSSWLAILSMIGIFGFAMFAYIITYSFLQLIRLIKKQRYDGALLFSFLTFWCLHLVSEGYIFASGSFLFFNFWLLLGVIHIIINNSKYALINF